MTDRTGWAEVGGFKVKPAFFGFSWKVYSPKSNLLAGFRHRARAIEYVEFLLARAHGEGSEKTK